MSNLKGLNGFLNFNLPAFLEGKTLVLNSIKFDSKNNVVKGELVIVEDSTTDNQYGKVGFKLNDSKPEDVNKYQLKNAYTFAGVDKVSVYGDFRDNLSITCKALTKVNTKQNAN